MLRLVITILLARGMVSKAFLRDPGTCRMMYFSDDMPPAEVARLQRLLARHASPVPVVDVRPPGIAPASCPSRAAPLRRSWSLARVIVLHSLGGTLLLD